MLKKIIIAILAISIIGGGLYLIKNQPNESQSTPTPETPKVEAKKFVDESTVLPSKTEEERILVKRDYNKGLEFLKNREISKEEKRKEELALTIQYIRDLGFEVDEENNTVSPLKMVENETIINERGYSYVFEYLSYENLMKLNNVSKNTYLLKLENPVGLDFVIDYEKLAVKNVSLYYGEFKNIKLENGELVNGSVKFSYASHKLETTIWLERNDYMPDLTFVYEHLKNKKNKGVINLRIDMNSQTGEKIYVMPVDDM